MLSTVNKLPQAYPLLVPSKAKLKDGSGVATMLSRLKSTHAFRQEFSSELEWTILTSYLLILPFNHRAYSFYLGLGQLKDRTIKSSIMSQAI